MSDTSKIKGFYDDDFNEYVVLLPKTPPHTQMKVVIKNSAGQEIHKIKCTGHGAEMLPVEG